MNNNPFSIAFGKKPYQYIERELIYDEIMNDLNAEIIQNQCFMLSGVRGSGKTVTMTNIENRLRDSKDWIVIGLNVERNMLESLVAKLYDTNKLKKGFWDASINLSTFGIGAVVKNIPPVADIESALEIMLKEIKKQGKRLLVTVDEVFNSKTVREFASTFQIMIRQDLPIFLLMAGLYENIHSLEDEKNLTFLYRAPKYHMTPLSPMLIKQSYKTILGVSEDVAEEMADLTKGYPFAYQALGKYVWESEKKSITDDVIIKYDNALEMYSYNKIWDEMSEMDRFYMSFIVKKEEMKTSELLERSGKNKNEFSQYKTRLSEKGVIDTSKRGIITVPLPRFREFVERKI
ncbi:MAG: ATP-binding protein [Eubacterium sp.]|nr:ATP-binding protein [Eubacterium sp.]